MSTSLASLLRVRNTGIQHHLAVILSAIFYGFITVGGKYFALAGFSLYEISSLIMFACLPLLPVLLFWRGFRISKRYVPFFLVFGLVGAALQLSQFAGIVLGLPVAVVALLLYTQPIWTTVLGRWLLRERITGTKILAAIIALLGTVFLVRPFRVQAELNLVGVGMAILAGFFLSLWIIWGRKSGIKNQHFVTTSFGYIFFTACFLLVLHPFVSLFLDSPDYMRLDFSRYAQHWPDVALFALFANLMPAFLAFAGMQRVDASTAGILLLFEPASAALLAKGFFDQAITSNIWIGGGLILLANVVLLRGEKR